MLLDDIKVSVITPTFNDELFIKDTIESILSQTHKNVEVIVVDDCSTDNTLNIINSFNDSRIKLIRNTTNQGAAYSRNLAISKASGDYIAFLDGDDLWMKDKLSKQLQFMLENNYTFSYTKYSVMNGDHRFDVGGPHKISHKMFLKLNYVGCLTVVYKKAIYPDLQIPNDIYKRNDYALWLKLSEKADCYLFDEVLSVYRRRTSNSISSGKKNKLLYFHRVMFQKLYRFNFFKASLLSLRNALYYLFRKRKYIEKK